MTRSGNLLATITMTTILVGVTVCASGGCTKNEADTASKDAAVPPSLPPAPPTPGTPTTPPPPPPPTTTTTTTSSGALPSAIHALPAGAGKALAESRCAICHTTQMLSQQRLTPTQWQHTVEKMAGWGAPINAAETEVLASYLAEHFTPSTAAPTVALTAPPLGATTP